MGNVVTFMTLVFIATAWPYSLSPMLDSLPMSTAQPQNQQSGLVGWVASHKKQGLGFVIVVGINLGAAVFGVITFLAMLQ